MRKRRVVALLEMCVRCFLPLPNLLVLVDLCLTKSDVRMTQLEYKQTMGDYGNLFLGGFQGKATPTGFCGGLKLISEKL